MTTESVAEVVVTPSSYMSVHAIADKTTRRPNNNANTGTSDANTGTAHPPGRTSGSPVPPPKSNAHVRLGWSQSYALHQGPVGYDHFSYSYRDKSGSKFHRSLGQPYGEAYETGDVIGCLIHMPDYTLSEDLFNSALTIVNPGKQHDIDPLNTEMLIVDFKGIPYYQITDELDRSLKALEPVEGR
ncbi:hypothetical protein SARC_05034 [Sphaeroforma arctica JP610]|uniref:SPRY domain-containing protein n=1 Tax=Sphaeroforma arctica JP610 TaxID=667725 RepID=A0A0L0G0V3_9EUKA|nr:hypothetical protein SARC_05034 [Sphaeroforma arctica JP610]KNC82695.1 hypothetical protein SARC_05034 [Sphaeroforma arctica JP610]|eukprot:XP_014156597.1 hypothetical protein SARC_05034 [Sphaeroforma arctica JP610]